MHSRVTLLEIDALRIDIDAALAAYREEILTRLRAQPGFAGVYVMVSPEGKGLVMTLWESEQAMDESAPIASDALSRFVTIFAAPPGRERYEVRLAELVAPLPSPT